MQVTLCDPYLSTLEAFARRRAIEINVYFTLLYFKNYEETVGSLWWKSADFVVSRNEMYSGATDRRMH